MAAATQLFSGNMKMDANEQGNNGNHAVEPFDEDSLSSCLPEISDIFEESVLFPRVGEQYQVKIPPVETKLELFQLRSISFDVTKMPSIDEFGLGLAIPVKWVQHAGDDIKIKFEMEEFSNVGNFPGIGEAAYLHKNKSTQVDYKFNVRLSAPENPKHAGKHLHRFVCKDEFFDSDQDNHVASSANYEMVGKNPKLFCLSLLQSMKVGDFYPLPGLPALSWSDAEKQSFLLGLYIFGKNLILVKKFMEAKWMGDVLSFYYGEFYRSDAYHRWSECRKIRSRRSIHGQRIFTGCRQQELLSRMLNSTPKESQNTLLEAAKTFNEGRATLEEFVFKLKAAVGLQVFVDAVGIGKGTQDLTGVVLDNVRTNPTIHLHPEIPVGRACSSLTCADIIKFLTGDFRLSKAKSNDLFWEAVWPRLLARGWHSEQPKDHGSLGFKNFLVFLVPGVKKFSRKRLVKGTHFFDSVSDVLSKVASDPRLLELDVEGVKGGSSINVKENEWDADAKVYRNGSFNHQRHSYLHPRRPSCNSERIKFTVVDTSLVQREGSFKFMELRSLPSGSISSCHPSGNSEESSRVSSSDTEDSTDASDEDDDNNNGSSPASFAKKKSEDNQQTQSEQPKTLIPLPNGYNLGDKRLTKVEDDKAVLLRCQNSRRVRSSQSNCSAPTMKRRKLTACSRGTDRHTCSVKRIQQHKQHISSKLAPLKDSDTLFQNKDTFQERTSIVSEANLHEGKQESKTFFDLNNLPPDADFAETSSSDLKTEDFLQSSASKQQVSNQASAQDSSYAPVDEQPSSGIRRQSTRNRPPTAKALEALASGLLGTKRSWRPPNSITRHSRKARKAYERASVIATNSSNAASSTVSTSVEETVGKNYESARKGTHELLGVP